MSDRDLPVGAEATVARPSDKKLHDYPRPIVAVDVALLTVNLVEGRLEVVQLWREDTRTWALPGTFVRQGETLSRAVKRCLRDKLGVEGIKPRQLHVFDDPDRDDRDWVISVAHVAVVRPEQLHALGTGAAAQTRLAPVDRPGELAWDHPDIVRRAKNEVRQRYEDRADPDRLLGPRFTLRELKAVHEAVLGEDDLGRDRFRRAMAAKVEGTGVREEDTGSRGRPAELFRRQ